jgi:hypothetical protein
MSTKIFMLILLVFVFFVGIAAISVSINDLHLLTFSAIGALMAINTACLLFTAINITGIGNILSAVKTRAVMVNASDVLGASGLQKFRDSLDEDRE